MAITATHQVFGTEKIAEVWTVPAGTPKHTLVTQGDRFGVTLVNATGVAGTEKELGPFKVSFPSRVGVGTEDVTAIAADAVGVALDGTWEFELAGTSATTTQGTPVYTDGTALTLTETGNRIGVINYPASYDKAGRAGFAPVKIGA